jgi:cytochrome P450
MKVAPTPREGLPFFGQLFEAWRDPLGMLRRSRAYGDVVRFKFGWLRYYLVSDPEGIKHVLVDNPRAYTKSRNYRGLKLVLGEGLLTSEGDFWRRQRKLTQPAFHREKMAGFAATMASCGAAMIDRWRSSRSPTIDVHAELMRVTFQIVGKTLLSTDLDDPNGAVGSALAFVLEYANDYAADPVPVPPWVPTRRNVRFNRALRTLDAIVQSTIEERRHRGSDASDLLGMLMAIRDDETNETMTDRQLRDELVTIVLAGHETTANALTWALYLLGKHPDVERRLSAEVAHVLGDRPPALADLQRLKLTKMVIEESLRLFPPAWMFERQALERDEICGYAIEPGAIIGISPYAVHRHPAYWEDSEAFDPDRFLPERSEGRPRYVYLPFGAGPRVCIGNGFAMIEAQILLATIVRSCRLELTSREIELSPLITLRPRRGLPASVHFSRPAATRASPEPLAQRGTHTE